MTFAGQLADFGIEQTIFFTRPGNSPQVSGRSCVTLNLVIRLLTSHWLSLCLPSRLSSMRAHMKVSRLSVALCETFCLENLSSGKKLESRFGTRPHSP